MTDTPRPTRERLAEIRKWVGDPDVGGWYGELFSEIDALEALIKKEEIK